MSPRPKTQPSKSLSTNKHGPRSSRKSHAHRSGSTRHSPTVRQACTSLQVRSQIPRALLLSPFTSAMTLPASSINHHQRKFVDVNCRNASQMVPISSFERSNVVVSMRHEDMIGTLVVPKKDMLMKRFLANSEDYANTSMQAQKEKLAAQIIFGSLLLNSFYRRLDDMKCLEREFAELKIVNENKRCLLRDCNARYISEQKRTEELQGQLKNSEKELRSLKITEENLITSLIEERTDKTALEQQIVMKNESIKTLIDQESQLNLYNLQSHIQKLHKLLEEEMLESQMLLEEKDILVLQLQDLKEKFMFTKHLVEGTIKAENNALIEIRRNASNLEMIKAENEDKKQQLKDNEIKMNREIYLLRTESEAMNVYMEHSFGNRMKMCYKNTVQHKKTILEWTVWILFFLVPVIPRQKLAQRNVKIVRKKTTN